MTRKHDIQQLRQQAAQLYHNRCYVCHKAYGKQFQFHHIVYLRTDKKHSDFTNWYDYAEYVHPVILADPGRFCLLCHTCHRLVSIMQHIKDDERFSRLVLLTKISRNRSSPHT